jgi:sugar/nucleoside kinase (ribokinase family)
MYTKRLADRPNHAPRIAGAGLLALDIVLCESDGPGAFAFAGGTCGNVLSILSFLRWTATPIGFLGDDPAGRRVLADLSTAGVRAPYLVQTGEWATPVFIQHLMRDDGGRPHHTFSTVGRCPNCGHSIGGLEKRANEGATPIQRLTAADNVDVFFMDRLSDDILSLAESAKAQGALVFYEPSSPSDVRYWDEAFALSDIVKYSADRFEEDQLAPYLARQTRKDLWEVKTLGARGLKYRRHLRNLTEAPRWVKSEAIAAPRVVDTCGAGDWCSAGLLHGLAAFGNDSGAFPNALRLGQLLAAWACAFVGARGAMYSSDQTAILTAIAALIKSGSLDLSSLPIDEPITPASVREVSSCVPGVCADPKSTKSSASRRR